MSSKILDLDIKQNIDLTACDFFFRNKFIAALNLVTNLNGKPAVAMIPALIYLNQSALWVWRADFSLMNNS